MAAPDREHERAALLASSGQNDRIWAGMNTAPTGDRFRVLTSIIYLLCKRGLVSPIDEPGGKVATYQLTALGLAAREEAQAGPPVDFRALNRHAKRDGNGLRGGKLTSNHRCDQCGESIPEDAYLTDDDVCGGGDGPGFYLCSRDSCTAEREGKTPDERQALYTARDKAPRARKAKAR